MRKGIIVAIAGLALLAGCGNQGDKISNAPKWKGAPYRIAFDTQAVKPNPVGVTIPAVKYTANPDALESRATLVVRFDSSELTKNTQNGPIMNKMIMAPVDIRGAEGTLPADYMNAASADLSRFLGAYCIKGKIKISVALARSSLSSQAGDAEVNAKRMSDWLPTEVVFKKPNPTC